MKNILHKLSIVLTVGALCSCTDMLNTVPADQVSSETMWTSVDLAKKGMNGLYESFYDKTVGGSTTLNRGNLDGYNKYGIEALGFCTDYYANGGTVHLLADENKPAGDCQLYYEWKFGYSIVHSCNDALANLGKAGLDDDTYQRYLCEARFLRAWAYSRLNKFWWGVPVYLEPVSNDECNKTQSTAAEVWQVVLDDCTFCIENDHFPTNTITDNIGRPSKGAAYALRGMAYMWMAAKNDDASQRSDGDAKAKEYYNLAEKDFAKVAECGYTTFKGNYIDFFTAENEHDPEMIFAIQYDEASGYCDDIQLAFGARDTYNCWTEVKPSADFVNYYQKADGSKFVWNEVAGLEDWNSLTAKERAVYFFRDGLNSNSAYASLKTSAINLVGQSVYDKYYLDNGNEARIRKAYADRDPRLQQTVLTPYEPVSCYASDQYNGGENQIDKALRWPLYQQGTNGGDFWLDKRFSAFYCYRKFVKYLKGEILGRARCHTDFPLIRYTDVLLQRAEALIELNRYSEAAALVNQTRSRAGMPDVTFSSLKDGRDAVRYERRVEFAAEAVNFFDEVRWGTYKETKFQGLDVHGGQSWWGDDTVEYLWYWQDCIWPWSVPTEEYQMNPALQQRDGWLY